MSRSSKKQIEGLEELKRIITDQETKIKELKRTIANMTVVPKVDKKSSPKTSSSEPNSSNTNSCPDCNGKVETIDLNVRTMFRCTLCNYRKTIKNG
jgi:formamidopyrimidine-DNA glycosylase